MKRVDFIYLCLVVSLAISVLANGPPRIVAVIEPGLSLIGLAVVVTSGILLVMTERRRPPHEARPHLDRQKIILLLWVTAGVVSSYQWLFYFRRMAPGLDLNLVLQWVTAGLSIASVVVLAQGLLKRLAERRAERAAVAEAVDEVPPPSG